MRRFLICIFAVLLTVSPLAAAERPLFHPKGDISVGLQAGYLGFNSSNSELFLLLDGVTASAAYTRISPYVEYSYANDASLGLRFDYSVITANVDDLTLDLLNDGTTFEVKDLTARSRNIGGAVFHRNWFGLDAKSRFGFFLEETLAYSAGRMQFTNVPESTAYTTTSRLKLSFSPGFEFFIMNWVSVSAYVSMGGISYNKATCYEAEKVTGTRDKFAARFGPDISGTGFGVSFHF